MPTPIPTIPTTVRRIVQTSATVSPVERGGVPTTFTAYSFCVGLIAVRFCSGVSAVEFFCTEGDAGRDTCALGWELDFAASGVCLLDGDGLGAPTCQSKRIARVPAIRMVRNTVTLHLFSLRLPSNVSNLQRRKQTSRNVSSRRCAGRALPKFAFRNWRAAFTR